MRPCVHTCVPRDCHLIMSHFATKALDPTYLADASRKLSFTFPKCTPQVDSPRMSPKTASGFIDQGFIFRRNCHEMFWTRLTTFHQSWHGDGIVFPILGPLQHRQPHTKARTSSTQNQPLKKTNNPRVILHDTCSPFTCLQIRCQGTSPVAGHPHPQLSPPVLQISVEWQPTTAIVD